MKGMVCSRCFDCKEYSIIKDFCCQNQIEPPMGFYTKGAIDRIIVPIKILFGLLALTMLNLPESAVVDRTTSGVDMSFLHHLGRMMISIFLQMQSLLPRRRNVLQIKKYTLN